MKVFLVKGSKDTDITRYCGSVSLSNSLDSLGSTLNFSLVKNIRDDNFNITEGVGTGDFIRFVVGDTQMFFGIIVDMRIEKYSKSISCLDFSFYLNNNKVIRQFKDIAASAAISELCRFTGVTVGVIDTMNTRITKIYRNNTVAEIIHDIIDKVTNETGVKYRMEINGEVFSLLKYKDIDVNLTYGNIIGRVSKQESIANMKNSIVIMSNNQDNVNKIGEARDEASMRRYGMLQEVIEVDPADIAKVRNMAQKKLDEYNKIATSASLDVIGSELLRSGRVVKLKNEEFGMNGKYLIKSCTHTFAKNVHTASIEVELV